MKQMDIPQQMQVPVDFESQDLSRRIKELRPVVWREGTDFCCLLGPDPQEGIFGCGNTAEAAMNDWETHLRERIENASISDEVAQYAIDTLNISKDDVW